MATSHLSTAATARIMLKRSISSFILLFRLIPAVSININFCPSFSTGESIASLVVPGILLTISLSSPNILLISDDLPTFGLPIMATFIASSSSSSASSGGNSLITASRRSPSPSIWPAEIGIGSPIARL